jgi:catechol 2,3-dioxygenase-like lactoylglutathione lyase family enzyme
MADIWLSNFGIRVSDFQRSIDFYTKVFDFEEVAREEYSTGKYVLFRDRRSKQRFELNWYSEASPFWAPFTSGEAFDHLDVRVKSVLEVLKRLKAIGIEPASKKLWRNQEAVAKISKDSQEAQDINNDVWITPNGSNQTFIQDPDGNYICLYDRPGEVWNETGIPDRY